MNTYFIRCIKSDFPRLLALGQKLGAITLTYSEFVQSTEENGLTVETPTGTPQVTATGGGAWDFIGEIPQADLVDSQGEPVYKPICDADGNPYIHVNLVTTLSLGELAANMAGTDEEVAAGLQDLGCFFLLDADGNARAPSAPYRVFL